MSTPPRFCVIFLLIAIVIAIPPTNRQMKYLPVREGGALILTIANQEHTSGHCCEVVRNNQMYKLLDSDKPIITANGEILEVVPIANQCALRIFGTNAGSAGGWMLRNHNGTTRRYNVTVLPAALDLGCPATDTDGCELINLDTNEKRFCGADVKDWSSTKYKCVYKATGSLEFKEEFLPRPTNSPIKTVTFHEVKPSETYHGNYILECKAKSKIARCTAEHLRTKRSFNINDGMQHSTYSAFKTRFEKGVCQFEVPQFGEDLRDEDVGKWALSITDEEGHYEQCHFILSPSKPRDVRHTKKRAVNKIQGSTIDCGEEVSYPITRCYMRDPDDKIIRQDSCLFKLGKVGRWTCGYNAVTAEVADEQREIHVHATGAIDPQANDLTMQCSHIYRSPLKTCLFISPTNRPFSVPLVEEEFKAGLCKITFESKEEMISGRWKCVIQGKNSDTDYSVDIEHAGHSEASAISP